MGYMTTDDTYDRMVTAYEKYATKTRVVMPSGTYDKILALLAELDEGGNARARQLRSELLWTRRVTGAD